MKTISLKHLVKTGLLVDKPLLNRQDVLEYFGKPDSWFVRNNSKSRKNPKLDNMECSSIWFYNNIEIYFHDEQVWMVHCENFDFSNNSSVQVDPWIFKPNMSLQDLTQSLLSENIPFNTNNDLYNEDCVNVNLFDTNIKLIVDNNTGLCTFSKL